MEEAVVVVEDPLGKTGAGPCVTASEKKIILI
jgi:hypothetical protein